MYFTSVRSYYFQEGQCKEKEGVWTTQNIRQECNYWTLEADAELLKHLQQFSQVIYFIEI